MHSLCERVKSILWWSRPCGRVHPNMLMIVLVDIQWIQLAKVLSLMLHWYQDVMSNPWNLWRFTFISFGDMSPPLWSRFLTLCLFFLACNAFLLFRHALVCSASFHMLHFLMMLVHVSHLQHCHHSLCANKPYNPDVSARIRFQI